MLRFRAPAINGLIPDMHVFIHYAVCLVRSSLDVLRPWQGEEGMVTLYSLLALADATPAVGRLGEPRSPPFVPQDRNICARHFILGPFILFHLLAVVLRIGVGCRPLDVPASSADAKPGQRRFASTPAQPKHISCCLPSTSLDFINKAHCILLASVPQSFSLKRR